MHCIRKSLIYSTRKEFLKKAVLERWSINSMRSPTANVLKGESITKVRFNFFFGPQTYIPSYIYVYIQYIYGHQPRSHNPVLAHARAG